MAKYYISAIIILIGIVIYLFIKVKKQYKKGANDTFTLFLMGAYEQRVQWFNTANKYMKNRPIVFVGDSITQEFMLTEMLNDYNVCNRGIGGDTTVGVLKRMKESIYDLTPSQLFLMIGTNDIGLNQATTDEIIKNIERICDETLREVKDIIINLVSLTPVGDIHHPKMDAAAIGMRTNQQINEINRKLSELATAKGFNYIDVNQYLKDETNHIRLDYTREGLHLSPKGYEKIVEVYKEYLSK